MIPQTKPKKTLQQLLIEGRQHELSQARNLCLWLWKPLKQNSSSIESSVFQSYSHIPNINLDIGYNRTKRIWLTIRERLKVLITEDINNSTGYLLAIEALNHERRRDLLLALLSQFDQIIHLLYRKQIYGENLNYFWDQIQPELRKMALEKMAGAHVQIFRNGELKSVINTLSSNCILCSEDQELPLAERMLAPLVQAQPVLLEGYLLSLDDERAVLQIEALVSNWLIRTAELIGAEILSECSDWPELRCYLLRRDLIVTRHLERLRNQLNTQEWWNLWFERPVRLYESKRLLWQIKDMSIVPYLITEPRDEELLQLAWWQQIITLFLEARDAIGPQVQMLLQYIGNIIVLVLTQIIGKAIGLIVRGIIQGMGRSFSRN